MEVVVNFKSRPVYNQGYPPGTHLINRRLRGSQGQTGRSLEAIPVVQPVA
jgi:hypothetical protein